MHKVRSIVKQRLITLDKFAVVSRYQRANLKGDQCLLVFIIPVRFSLDPPLARFTLLLPGGASIDPSGGCNVVCENDVRLRFTYAKIALENCSRANSNDMSWRSIEGEATLSLAAA